MTDLKDLTIVHDREDSDGPEYRVRIYRDGGRWVGLCEQDPDHAEEIARRVLEKRPARSVVIVSGVRSVNSAVASAMGFRKYTPWGSK